MSSDTNFLENRRYTEPASADYRLETKVNELSTDRRVDLNYGVLEFTSSTEDARRAASCNLFTALATLVFQECLKEAIVARGPCIEGSAVAVFSGLQILVNVDLRISTIEG
jgi:hypothetical protein